MPNRSQRFSVKTYSLGGTQIDRVETAIGSIPDALGSDHSELIALLDAAERYHAANPQVGRIQIEIVNSDGAEVSDART